MIIFLIIIDQTAKFAVVESIYSSNTTLVNGVLNLTYVENTGGAFGIGSSNIVLFVILNVVIITVIASIIILKRSEISISRLISLGLILAGGIGNLIDRICRGFVVDYIDISPLIEYPVFNIADICVVVGCVVVGIGELNEQIRNKKRRTRN